jgi:hypothetical protein
MFWKDTGKNSAEMNARFSRIFTLKVDGRPILAFEAGGHRDAQQICKELWLHDDLAELKSGGVALYTAQSKLSVRPASPDEEIIFLSQAAAKEPSEDMMIGYLIEIDS